VPFTALTVTGSYADFFHKHSKNRWLSSAGLRGTGMPEAMEQNEN